MSESQVCEASGITWATEQELEKSTILQIVLDYHICYRIEHKLKRNKFKEIYQIVIILGGRVIYRIVQKYIRTKPIKLKAARAKSLRHWN